MTRAGVDRWRAREREGKTARAREEWSIVSAERRRRERRKERASFTIKSQRRNDSHAPKTNDLSETFQHHLNPVKTNQKIHHRAKNIMLDLGQ